MNRVFFWSTNYFLPFSLRNTIVGWFYQKRLKDHKIFYYSSLEGHEEISNGIHTIIVIEEVIS